jgi:hypothetical protein
MDTLKANKIYEVQWKDWEQRWKTLCFCRTREKASIVAEAFFNKNYDIRIRNDKKVLEKLLVKLRN